MMAARRPFPLAGLGTAGPVMVIGGAEDRVRDKVILSRFSRFAGGEEGHVVVISTASSPMRFASSSILPPPGRSAKPWVTALKIRFVNT